MKKNNHITYCKYGGGEFIMFLLKGGKRHRVRKSRSNEFQPVVVDGKRLLKSRSLQENSVTFSLEVRRKCEG